MSNNNNSDNNPNGAGRQPIGAGAGAVTTTATSTTDQPTSKLKDTLFGPSIGVVSTGPAWTVSSSANHQHHSSFTTLINKSQTSHTQDTEKIKNDTTNTQLVEGNGDSDTDELTPEIVRSWIAKSREVSVYPFG